MEPLVKLRKIRLEKLEKIKKLGINPYPAKSEKKQDVKTCLKSQGSNVQTAGRIMAIRIHGGSSFMNLEDESGKIQLFFDTSKFSTVNGQLLELLDIGDFIQVSGKVDKTQAGQITIFVGDLKLLTKSIRPIPTEFYGLKDTETKLRKRYLDLLANPPLRDLFIQKSKFWQETRNHLLSEEFLEVETPILEQTPGGADAKPFITHHHAHDIDLYLRISPELHLKRLLIGGFDKVFEIGRIFRNEGIDAEHLQDYTQMELYWAYADNETLMDFVEKMIKRVIEKTFGSLKTKWQDQEIDWSKKWPRVDYFTLLSKEWGEDASKLELSKLYKLAQKFNIKIKPNLGKGRILDYIYKKTIRPKLVQPQFLINPPVEIEPLAKRSPQNPNIVERLQILAMATELGKGFSELNDPIDQRQRFEEQMELRKKGDEEAQMMDEDFVEALEYGMPPAAGFAYSDRLFASIVGKPIRETVFFPTIKPEKS